MVIRFPIFPYHQKPYFFLSDTIFLHLIVESLSIYGEQLCSLALVAACCFQRSLYSLQFCFLIVQGGWGLRLDVSHTLFQFGYSDVSSGGEQGTRFITLFNSRRLPGQL